MDERVFTVSEITSQVKQILEGALPLLWVEGEISNFVHHSSGHMYFTLKDPKSQLKAVMFRHANVRLTFRPKDGMKVVARGSIKVYEPAGRYQIIVEALRPAGLGALALAFEKLKKKLQAEGLFASTHKRPIPRFPGVVAVVTSPTGAAVRDMIRVIGNRFPGVQIVVVPTAVQGAKAAAEIAASVRLVDEWGGADVAIVGRGGGSLEDLWAFNEEEVARAIFGCRTPIVSAVGHEVDFTIADFVADVRAATPSNAAELVVPDGIDLERSIALMGSRLETAIDSRLERLAERVEAARGAYAFRRPGEFVERFSQRVDELERRLALLVIGRIAAARARLERFASELRALDPDLILARGFARVALLPERASVTSVTDIQVGSEVRVTVKDGSFDCDVKDVPARKRRKR